MDIDPLRLQSQARAAAPDCRFWSLRAVTETSQSLRVRQDIAEAPSLSRDRGLMITVVDGGGIGHAATSDPSGAGMRRAFERAQSLARIMAGRGVFDFGSIRMPSPRGTYRGPEEKPLPASLAERYDYLQRACGSLKIDPRIVDWSAQAWFIETEQVYLTGDGGTTVQHFRYAIPNLTAVARVAARPRPAPRPASTTASAGRAAWRCWTPPGCGRTGRGSRRKRCSLRWRQTARAGTWTWY